ncbi:hypothetical protein MLP_38500 [Microlunatus phosphovorus NM-1]|uniref:Uncharacterized protein n=1 Tax=Microlunatus phosphovorus (strain ATCC 700054 / DSM 10555 / JCM 9379 / NBRC 101784 / NCIMB 13414 / VKM Ac-1990 / NM-1) TaxID=1032480 RepID=F5XQ33_MICPN|nr:hypothetical protein MLP_38500 [Microlunatus phosphovorus NM-1]
MSTRRLRQRRLRHRCAPGIPRRSWDVSTLASGAPARDRRPDGPDVLRSEDIIPGAAKDPCLDGLVSLLLSVTMYW